MGKKIYVKNEKMFKSKWQMIIYILIFAFLIYMFIYLGTMSYSHDIKDNEKFAMEFNQVGTDNVYKYVDVVEARMVAAGQKGIVLFGMSNNEWVNYYAKIVNDVAKEVGIKEIYYYDFRKNRQENNGSYEDILVKLENYVTYNDKGNADMYAPSLLVVSKDEVLYFDSETAFITGKVTPQVYWNSFEVGKKKAEIKAAFLEYLQK